jgi:hypothetical protein
MKTGMNGSTGTTDWRPIRLLAHPHWNSMTTTP